MVDDESSLNWAAVGVAIILGVLIGWLLFSDMSEPPEKDLDIADLINESQNPEMINQFLEDSCSVLPRTENIAEIRCESADRYYRQEVDLRDFQ